MKKDSYFFKLLILFFTFMRIGALTFGGGYAMIPIIEDEVVRKRKWITELEIMDVLAISESTPGPIAVNSATFVGYKVGGILGSVVATLGLAVPSFAIIFVISFFYRDFIQWPVIDAAFKGLKIGVILLLFTAVVRLKKGIKINLWGLILFSIALSAMIVFSFVNTGFNYLSLCLILLGIITGLILTALGQNKEDKE